MSGAATSRAGGACGRQRRPAGQAIFGAGGACMGEFTYWQGGWQPFRCMHLSLSKQAHAPLKESMLGNSIVAGRRAGPRTCLDALVVVAGDGGG